MFRLRHRHGILGQEGSGARRAQLERLRGEARVNGPEGLRAALQDLSVKEVRELAQAAGLRVRTDGNVTWLRGVCSARGVCCVCFVFVIFV